MLAPVGRVTQSAYPKESVAILAFIILVIFFPTLFFGRHPNPLEAVSSSEAVVASQPHRIPFCPSLLKDAAWGHALMDEVRSCFLECSVWSERDSGGRPGWLIATFRPGLATIISAWWPAKEARWSTGLILRLLLIFYGSYLLARSFNLSPGAASVAAAAVTASGVSSFLTLLPQAGDLVAATPILLLLIKRAVRSGPNKTLQGSIRTSFLSATAWLATILIAGGKWGSLLPGILLWLALVEGITATVPCVLGFSLATLMMWPIAAAGSLSWHTELAWEPAIKVLATLIHPFALADPTATITNYSDWAVRNLYVGPVALLLALSSAKHKTARKLLFVGLLLALATSLVNGKSILPSVFAVIALSMAAGIATDQLLPRIFPPKASWRYVLAGWIVSLGGMLAAAHVLPYPKWADVQIPNTLKPLTTKKASTATGRTAPLFDLFESGLASTLGMNDIRCPTRCTDERYLKLLTLADPQAEASLGALLNGATIKLASWPLRALGVRWFIEPKAVHLVQEQLLERFVEGPLGTTYWQPLASGQIITATLALQPNCRRVGAWFRAEGGSSATVAYRVSTRGMVEANGKWIVGGSGLRWIELPSTVENAGEATLTLWVEKTSGEPALQVTEDGSIAVWLDTSGVRLALESDGLRVWEDTLACKNAWLAPPSSNENRLVEYCSHPTNKVVNKEMLPSRLSISVDVGEKAWLVASRKFNQKLLQVLVDGRRVKPERVLSCLVAIPLEPGHHNVELSYRIPARWLLISAMGWLAWLIAGFGSREGLG